MTKKREVQTRAQMRYYKSKYHALTKPSIASASVNNHSPITPEKKSRQQKNLKQADSTILVKRAPAVLRQIEEKEKSAAEGAPTTVLRKAKQGSVIPAPNI